MGALPWAQMELPQRGRDREGHTGVAWDRAQGWASHHWYRKELRSVKSSRGSWDSSVTQLLKLKVSAGPVWLVYRVPAVLLVAASRPWKYCQMPGEGLYRVTLRPTLRNLPAFPLPPPGPALGMAWLMSVGTVSVCPCAVPAPGTQLELSEYTLN